MSSRTNSIDCKANAKWTTMELAIAAVFVALTFIATASVNVRIFDGNGGLIHLGCVPLFVAGFVFGPRVSAIAGALGMGLFDITSGWALWAPTTVIVSALMGIACGYIAKKGSQMHVAYWVLAVLAAMLIKVGGYYVGEAIIYGNWIAPVKSIMGNIVQVGVGGIIAILIGQPLKYALKKMNFNLSNK